MGDDEADICPVPSTLLGTLPDSLYLADRGSITGAQAALAVMLSMSMVGRWQSSKYFLKIPVR